MVFFGRGQQATSPLAMRNGDIVTGFRNFTGAYGQFGELCLTTSCFVVLDNLLWPPECQGSFTVNASVVNNAGIMTLSRDQKMLKLMCRITWVQTKYTLSSDISLHINMIGAL